MNWIEVIGKLLRNQPHAIGRTSIRTGQGGDLHQAVFVIAPAYSIAQALAQALRVDGINAYSFEIGSDCGEVLVISGLAGLPVAAVEHLESWDTSASDRP